MNRPLRTTKGSATWLPAVIALTVTASAQGQSPPARATVGSAILVTDRSGTKHVLRECAQNRGIRFQNSGTPFSGAVALDPQYEASISQLSTFIALNFHTPTEQKRILQAALDRGMGEYGTSEGFSGVILLVPLSSVEVITFGEKKGERNREQTSSVKVAGRPAFDAGTGYADLRCKEDLGPLGQSDFSAWAEDLKEIRASGEPQRFVSDFSVFGTHAVPFKASVTDTSGRVIVFEKAMFSQHDTVERSRYPYVGSTGYATVTFGSDLAVTRSETSHLSLSSEKLRRIQVVKNHGTSHEYDAKMTLRTGESFDLTISPPADPSGILGATPDGWVWVPWYAVSAVDFPD